MCKTPKTLISLGGGTVCLYRESAQIGQNSPIISRYRHTQTGGVMPSGLGVFVLQKNKEEKEF